MSSMPLASFVRDLTALPPYAELLWPVVAVHIRHEWQPRIGMATGCGKSVRMAIRLSQTGNLSLLNRKDHPLPNACAPCGGNAHASYGSLIHSAVFGSVAGKHSILQMIEDKRGIERRPCVHYRFLNDLDLTMTITISEELRAYIDPLTEDESAALESSLLAEGCRDALVLWRDLLVDGHNRYRICQKHGIPFTTVQNTNFKTLEDVHLWMIDNHLGRRSVSDFQRGVLALRKKEILSARLAQLHSTPSPAPDRQEADAAAEAPPPLTREAMARTARVSSATLGQIEKIQKTAAPELVSAVKAGVISINAAATVASLPVEEQVAAVAGGKTELRKTARQVRQARLPSPKPAPPPPPDDATPEQLVIHRLQLAVAELTAERDQLKTKVQHLTIALAEARAGN